jgi:signal transduction histidine kinase
MLFRFANRQSLECLLGETLTEELDKITGKPMSYLLQERLLNDPRLAIPFRTVQHIRQMVYHDPEGALKEPVLNLIVPLLVGRLRQCQGTHHDAWLAMEIYLCLGSIEERYGYSQWSLVSTLLQDGCSLPLLELLAERQRVLPPRDARCREVVEALNRAEGVSVGDLLVAARRQLFDNLGGEVGESGILACVRILTAVAIAFDSTSEPDLRTRARAAIEKVHVESMQFPPSLGKDDVDQLLECAYGLIQLPRTPSSEARGELYSSLRQSLDRLLGLKPPGVAQVGLFESDVIWKIFLESREFVQRQVEIEFYFVAPLQFLQEQSFAGVEVADEQMLSRKLLSYAALQGDLSQAWATLLLTRDSTLGVAVLDVLGAKRSREFLPSRAQIRRRLEVLLPPPLQIEFLRDEATRLLDSGSTTGGAPTLDLFNLSSQLVGEIIPIEREGELYGLIFFAYERSAAPDPSKRAMARMVPQFLVSEFMRSVQTQRLLSLTFHHISAPIAAMRRMLRNITDGYIEPDEQEKYLENLWLMAEDCRLMIENHQNYVRMVRGIAPPVLPARFDLTTEAEFRRKIVHYKYKKSKQTVRWGTTPEAIEVTLDPILVGDIIQNLLDNACKYSPARTEVRLSVEGNRREVFITVSDQGPGLPDKVSASLYGEGVRGERASHSTREGLGLGLFMISRYVEWLDGAVWHDSSKGGTTFTVRLPREFGHR